MKHGSMGEWTGFFYKDLIYLFLERGEGREKEGEKTSMSISCFSLDPQWGPGPQPRHMP